MAEAATAGLVIDTADILPVDDEALLDRHLRDYWRQYETAIVVASVQSLDGQSIEEFALDMFNSWGIGDARTNRGLLILVAPTERQVRIEAGCGLEAVITADVAKNIIEAEMIPNFRAGDYVGAVEAGVDALAEKLADNPEYGPDSPACLALMKKAA